MKSCKPRGQNKQSHLEALRGLAALMVVFGHYLAAFYPSAKFGRMYPQHAAWESLIYSTPLGLPFASQMAVCLFFILSGYVLSLRFFGTQAKGTVELLGAIIRRPFRLGALVVFTELLSWSLLQNSLFFNTTASTYTFSSPWFAETLPIGRIPVRRLLFNVAVQPFAAGANYNPPLWTIQIELYGSFLTFIFLLLFRNSKWRPAAYVLAFIWLWDQYYQAFIFGILCADLNRNWTIRPLGANASGLFPFLMVLLGLFICSYPASVPIPDIAGTIYRYFPRLHGLGGGVPMLGAAVFFSGVLLSTDVKRWLTAPWLEFLGRISYPLYAIHFLLLGSFSAWLFLTLREYMGYHAAVTGVVVVSVLLLLPLSYLIARFVDEPVTEFTRRVESGWRRSLAPPPE